jgi:hypothetical protein
MSAMFNRGSVLTDLFHKCGKIEVFDQEWEKPEQETSFNIPVFRRLKKNIEVQNEG